jgi:pyruvate dehydrogenase E2 component (dihydrolipoamide acetyltransferase)
MAEIKLPYIFPEMEGGVLLRWLIQPGQRVEIDQDIARIKVGDETLILPSPLDGQVKTLCVKEGELVAVGEPLAVLEEVNVE